MKSQRRPLLGFRLSTLAVGLTLWVWAGGAHPAFAQCETQKLLAFDGVEGDSFGSSISVSGDILVVGAKRKDEQFGNQGSVYVYRRNPIMDTWLFETKLFSSRSWWNGAYGSSVSVNGDRIAIGAPLASDLYSNTGIAYVFRYDPTSSTWIEEAEFRASNCLFLPVGDRFGASVSLYGDILVVGAPFNGGIAGGSAGAACVYRFDGTAWQIETSLFAEDGASGDWFGYHVSTGHDVILIGSDGHSANGQYAGAVYVYRYNTITLEWTLETKLMPSDAAAQDFFGWSLDLDGDVAIISSYGNDDSGEKSGSAYIFRYDTITSMWTEEAKLLPADGATGDMFGRQVVLNENVATVNALNGDGLFPDSGSVYIFRYDGLAWNEEIELFATDNGMDNGFTISESDGVVFVGASGDDYRGWSTGSAYIFDSIDATCCPADTDGNGVVTVSDLLELLSAWGACPVPCPSDHNRDGFVNVTDLLKLLSNWGTCP